MFVTAHRSRGECGQVVTIFALLLPVVLGIGAIVIGLGNWYTHAKHLQTKADASAFAGGGVWGFPCGPDVDANIESEARTFLGPHTQADGSVFSSTTFNPQVGGVDSSKIHAVLNGSDWYDDDSNPTPAEQNDPAGSICEAKILDVKATEDNSFPLFSLIPLFPDIKRKARVQLNEVESLSGVLPISVRVPKPLSAAAIFYDESSGDIIPGGVKYLCESSSVSWLPSELSGWTTYDPANPMCASQASINVRAATGVAIALAIRPACDPSATPPITTNCFEDSGFATVDDLCRQGSGRYVECFYKSGDGSISDGPLGSAVHSGLPNRGGDPPQRPPGVAGRVADRRWLLAERVRERVLRFCLRHVLGRLDCQHRRRHLLPPSSRRTVCSFRYTNGDRDPKGSQHRGEVHAGLRDR